MTFTEAYEAYLKGLFHYYKLSPEHVALALDYYQLALEKDPNYALAYTGIAGVWVTRGIFGIVPPLEAFPKVKEAVLKALELDDTLSEVHYSLAIFRFYFEWDWGGAESEFQRAIELNPNNANIHLIYSSFLDIMGRPEEAIAEIERALERGYAEAGYPGAMSLAAEKLAERSKQIYVQSTQIARLYDHAREEDRAFEWLEKAYEEREPALVDLNVWPQGTLRDDPRFQALLQRMNFPELK